MRLMSEALWGNRPRPQLGSPGRAVLRGTPTTLAELRALRMQLRADLENGSRPPGAADDDLDRLLLAFEELVSNGLRHGGGAGHGVVTGTGAPPRGGGSGAPRGLPPGSARRPGGAPG